MPNNDVIEESSVQQRIDTVYPDTKFMNLDYSGVVFVDGKWQIKELCHYPKSALLDVLDINSAVCITENDIETYLSGNAFNRAELEIPVSYKSMAFNNLEQIDEGSRPFIIPNQAYDTEKGLISEYTKPQYYKTTR